MSARKLGRLAGLVLVLAAMVGGASAQLSTVDGSSAVEVTTQIVDWG